jgi:hypothetical protein
MLLIVCRYNGESRIYDSEKLCPKTFANLYIVVRMDCPEKWGRFVTKQSRTQRPKEAYPRDASSQEYIIPFFSSSGRNVMGACPAQSAYLKKLKHHLY